MDWPTEDCYVVVTEFDCGPEFRGRMNVRADGPIVGETYLKPDDCSLEAARSRAKQAGTRYGETRIAKLVWVKT